MTKLKDVGLTRNSDLVELGVDEFEHLDKPVPKAAKPEKKVKKKAKK
jgi:hypothetical protein